MKTTITLLMLAVFSLGLNAQLPADFETAKADTSWTQFANAGDAPENMSMAANPAKDGINTSDSCLMLTVLPAADPWVGMWSEVYAPLEFTADNHMMEFMIYKSFISNCGLKLEAGTGVNVEVLIPNTKMNEWELITIDFTAAIGFSYNRLVVFPDFPDPRAAGSTVYIDNINWVGGGTSVKADQRLDISIYPNPAAERITVQHVGMNSITISNVVGQTVKSLQFQGSNSEVIDVSDLKNGLYLMILETEEGPFSSKFVKR